MVEAERKTQVSSLGWNCIWPHVGVELAGTSSQRLNRASWWANSELVHLMACTEISTQACLIERALSFIFSSLMSIYKYPFGGNGRYNSRTRVYLTISKRRIWPNSPCQWTQLTVFQRLTYLLPAPCAASYGMPKSFNCKALPISTACPIDASGC